MIEKVSVMLKMDALVKEMLVECSRLEKRTMSAYVEMLVEADAKSKGLDLISLKSLLTERRQQVVVRSDSVLDMELPDGMERDLWCEFVSMRKTSKRKGMTAMTETSARYIVKQSAKAIANGWNINTLLEEATAKEWKMPVYEKHLTSTPDGRIVTPKKVLSTKELEALRLELKNHECVGLRVSRECWSDYIDAVLSSGVEFDMERADWLSERFRKKNGNRICENNEMVLQRAIEQNKFIADDGEWIIDLTGL